MSALKEQASYLLGMHVASQQMVSLLQQYELEPGPMLQGASDFLSRAEPKFDPSTIQEVMSKMDEAAQAKQSAAAETNAAASRAYMDEVAGRDGITVTDSGLAYEVITVAEGDSPAATDQVTVHYEGKLIDGTIFDSSRQRGEPTSFGLNQVIPGWTEGLQLMQTGATYRFHIPANLAYGTNAPPSIGPEQALVFEVELISIG